MAELPTDRGWAWFIVLGGFNNLFWMLGSYRVLGVVFIEVLEYYQANATPASLMFAMTMVGRICTMALYPMLVRLVSCRTIALCGAISISVAFYSLAVSSNIYVFAICFGLLFGCGSIAIQFTTMSVLAIYFKKKLSIASGLTYMGSSTGQLVIPQLLNYLLSQYGFSGGMYLYGAVVLQLVIGAALYRPVSFYSKRPTITKKMTASSSHDKDKMSKNHVTSKDLENGSTTSVKEIEARELVALDDDAPDDKFHVSIHRTNSMSTTVEQITNEDTSDTRAKSSLKSTTATLCSSVNFQMFNIGRFFAFVVFYSNMLYIAPYAKEEGFNSDQIALMLTISGAVELPSQFLHGWITSYRHVDATIYSGLATILGAIVTFACVMVPSYTSVMIMAPVLACLYSSITCLSAVMITDNVGAAWFATGVSFVNIPPSITMTIMPILFGYLSDITGHYVVPMLITATFAFLGGVVTILARIFCKKFH